MPDVSTSDSNMILCLENYANIWKLYYWAYLYLILTFVNSKTNKVFHSVSRT